MIIYGMEVFENGILMTILPVDSTYAYPLLRPAREGENSPFTQDFLDGLVPVAVGEKHTLDYWDEIVTLTVEVLYESLPEYVLVHCRPGTSDAEDLDREIWDRAWDHVDYLRRTGRIDR